MIFAQNYCLRGLSCKMCRQRMCRWTGRMCRCNDIFSFEILKNVPLECAVLTAHSFQERPLQHYQNQKYPIFHLRFRCPFPSLQFFIASLVARRRSHIGAKRKAMGDFILGSCKQVYFGFPIQIPTSRMSFDGLRTITGEYGVINKIEKLIQCKS